MSLTIADVKRWDPDAVQDVATQLAKRGATVEQVRDGLGRLPMFASWRGQAGAAVKESIDTIAAYLLAHQDAQQAAAAAMQKSAADIWIVKRLLTAAEDEARGKYSIDEATGAVTPLTKDAGSDASTMQDIQTKLQQVLALANTADAELAHAVNLLDGVDKPGQDPHITVPSGVQTAEAVEYAKNWRQHDLGAVRAAGLDSPEGHAAAARLRDYDTLTNPNVGADAKKYAAERLNDWSTAHNQNIGQPKDPTYGRTPTQRAQARLNMQKLLESPELQGRWSPDEVTQMLDRSEVDGRKLMLKEIENNLQRGGMSAEGARAAVGAIGSGESLNDVLNTTGKATSAELGSFGEATKYLPDKLPRGNHWQEGIRWSPEDIKALESIGKRAGMVGTLIDLSTRLDDVYNGAPIGDTALRFGGSMGGTMAGAWGGAQVCAIGGPEAAAVCAVLGGVGGGWAGEEAVNKVLDAVKGK